MIIDGTRAFLFDLDGVWFVGDELVAGAVETLTLLRERRYPCRFVTNTTTRTAADMAARLQGLGLDIAQHEIINAPLAAAIYLRERGNPPCHLLVADGVRGEFAGIPESDEPRYVVIGDIGDRWDYEVMNRAFRMVVGGADILALHRGRYWQVDDGLALDVGAFVAGLEYAASKPAILAGKPARTMFESALRDLGLGRGEVMMVGDDIHADVGGAQAAGIRAIMVRTGKYRDSLVARSGITPDATIDSVASLPNLLPR